MRSDITYRFSIVNFSKPDSLYNYGMKPVLYSQIEAEKHFVGWSRVGSNIRYYRNESMFDEDEGYSFTLTFTINFPHDNDTVYLAHCYPYTYRYVFSNFLQKKLFGGSSKTKLLPFGLQTNSRIAIANMQSSSTLSSN